jgi:hypothetical protein
MKGRVETSDLGHVGEHLADGFDHGDLAGKVQRRERNQPAEPVQQLVIDDLRRRVVRAAMNDTMANGSRPVDALPLQVGEELPQRGGLLTCRRLHSSM